MTCQKTSTPLSYLTNSYLFPIIKWVLICWIFDPLNSGFSRQGVPLGRLRRRWLCDRRSCHGRKRFTMGKTVGKNSCTTWPLHCTLGWKIKLPGDKSVEVYTPFYVLWWWRSEGLIQERFWLCDPTWAMGESPPLKANMCVRMLPWIFLTGNLLRCC